jgi:hypothetical protein
MPGNIIGEVFDKYVTDQIGLRQRYLGTEVSSDFNSNNEYALQWKHNNSAWVRLASSVNITEARAKKLGLNNNYAGNKLAKNFILYNGVSSLTTDSEGNQLFNPSSNNTEYFIDDKNTSLKHSYGFGGLTQGIRPMPGIDSVKIGYINRGTLATAEIEITAFNREQLNIIDTLFMHPGYTFLLEWGWTYYVDNNSRGVVYNNKDLITSPFKSLFTEPNISTQYTLLEDIKFEKQKRSGNYEGFYGVIKNFKFTFQPNGTYKITIYAISQGDLIENLKINNVDPTQASNTKNAALTADQRRKREQEILARLAAIPGEIERKNQEKNKAAEAYAAEKPAEHLQRAYSNDGETVSYGPKY